MATPVGSKRTAPTTFLVLQARSVHTVILSPDAPAVFPDGRCWRPDADGTLHEDILENLDGVVLSGGGDVHPSRFGQELNGAEPDRIDPKRDALELALTSRRAGTRRTRLRHLPGLPGTQRRRRR